MAKYSTDQSGKYVLKKITDLDKQNNIGYFLNIYEQIGLVYFLGDKGLIIYNKKTHKHKKYPVPKVSKSFFLDHFIDGKIILNEVGGNKYFWDNQKKVWQKTTQYSFLKTHKAQFTLSLDNGSLLIVNTKGEVFHKKEHQNLILERSLTDECKGGYSFEATEKDNLLYLKMHNKFLIYDLRSQKVLLKKTFRVRISSFAISEAGNVWLSTMGKGIFFVEYNSIFKVKDNVDQIYRQFHIGNEIFTLRQNKAKLEITSQKGQTHLHNLGLIWNVKAVGGVAYICSSKGLFKKNFGKASIDKIYDEECFNIYELSTKQLLILCNDKAFISDLDDSKVISKIKIKGRLINSIEFDNAIFIATENQCLKVNLSPERAFSGLPKQIIKAGKNEGFFNFFKFDQKLFIHNIENLYTFSHDKGVKLLTKEIHNFPRNNSGRALVKFTNISKLNNDSLLVTPVLGGEHNGANLPGLIIKKQDQYVWYDRPFKRLRKYEMDNLNNVSQHKFQIITPINIIEFNPFQKINTSYSFQAYIQQVQIKVSSSANFDQQQKEIITDSTIFFGNIAQKIITKLNYQQNTLTFTYASDSWAAYERNEYSYQLVGQDETWSKWSKEQKKEYTNLHEGTYTFQVRCKNVYGTISSIATYTFTILPPWYRTWWAYTLYSLAILGLLVGGSMGYSRLRTRQIRRRNQELEQVVEVRTEEIRAKNEEITQQNEEITQQSEELKATNDKLKKANELIRKDRDEKVKIYLQEATEATTKLQEIQETFTRKGPDFAQKLLKNEINTAGELSIIQEKVRNEFPDFVDAIDKALADKTITKITWQVGYCLKFGRSPAEIAKILPLSNRTVSVYGTKLRKLGILEAIKK